MLEWPGPGTATFYAPANSAGGTVEKPGTTVKRLIFDCSFPKPGRPLSGILKSSRDAVPISTSGCTLLPPETRLSWNYIESNAKAVAVMAASAQERRLSLLGPTNDMHKWVRMLAMAPAEWWKCIVFFDGGIRASVLAQC